MSCELWVVSIFCPKLAAHCSQPNALGIGAASFAERNGKWDSGTGIGKWDLGTGIWERGEMKRAKI